MIRKLVNLARAFKNEVQEFRSEFEWDGEGCVPPWDVKEVEGGEVADED